MQSLDVSQLAWQDLGPFEQVHFWPWGHAMVSGHPNGTKMALADIFGFS